MAISQVTRFSKQEARIGPPNIPRSFLLTKIGDIGTFDNIGTFGDMGIKIKFFDFIRSLTKCSDEVNYQNVQNLSTQPNAIKQKFKRVNLPTRIRRCWLFRRYGLLIMGTGIIQAKNREIVQVFSAIFGRRYGALPGIALP